MSTQQYSHKVIQVPAFTVYFDSALCPNKFDRSKFLKALSNSSADGIEKLIIDFEGVRGSFYSVRLAQFMAETGAVNWEKSVRKNHKSSVCYQCKAEHCEDPEWIEYLNKEADRVWNLFQQSVIPIELVDGVIRAVVLNDRQDEKEADPNQNDWDEF
jgi:hypothetical protein